MADAVLIFVRAPEAGRVKTRLAAEVGAEAALRVYRRLAEHAVAQARALGPRVAVRIHFTPGDAGDAVRGWLEEVEGTAFLPQADDYLGGRIRAAFDEAFDAGFRRVVIVGSDLPGLSGELLRRAFDLLDAHPAVLGPARDGGYYLLGLKAPLAAIFQDVPWSTGEVLAATLARMHVLGLRPALLETLGDVDEAADLPPGWREWAEPPLPEP